MIKADLDWLSGLLEGEGSFTLTGTDKITPTISLEMVDRDIVQRAATLFHRECKNHRKATKIRQATYRVTVYSEDAVKLMKLLYPLLGQRRRKQVKKVFNKLKDHHRKWAKKYMQQAKVFDV